MLAEREIEADLARCPHTGSVHAAEHVLLIQINHLQTCELARRLHRRNTKERG